jgi:hypothetical protein
MQRFSLPGWLWPGTGAGRNVAFKCERQDEERRRMNVLFDRSSWIAVIACAALFAALAFHESASVAFPYVNLDEQGHISYALHLVRSSEFFPSLTGMRLYDFVANAWSGEPNFINHPPLAYHLLNLFSDFDPLGPGARMASISFFALGFAAIIHALHRTGMFSNLGLAAVAMFCVLLKVQRFGETFSNDSVAFLGGGLAFLGSVLLWEKGVPKRPLHAAFAISGLGTALCIAAKLNAGILAGSFTLVMLAAFALQDRAALTRAPKPLLLLAAALCLAATLPYLAFIQEFGTPAPNTPGHVKVLSQDLDAPRMEPAVYLLQSLIGALRNAGSDAFLTYALFAAVTAGAALVISFRRQTVAGVFPLQPFARAALIATTLTLAVHLGFSLQRHLRYGWQPELYPRYYFPLLGPYLLLFFSVVSRAGPLRAFAPRLDA